MRFPFATLLVLGLTTGVYGQVPVITVAGKPFSADEVIVENPRPNVQGVIPIRTIRVYRDSAGRSRVDVSIPPDHTATPFVSIEDPVAGVHYLLDEKNKIARRLTYPPPRAKPGSMPPASNTFPVPFNVLPGIPGLRDVHSTSESLGTQIIGGLEADGKRVTSTGPPSPRCENVSISDSWYSLELRSILLQSHSNCSGNGTTRLENISRDEPDPYLFGVPSDYTIVEQEWSHGVNTVGPPLPPMPPFEFPQLPPPATK